MTAVSDVDSWLTSLGGACIGRLAADHKVLAGTTNLGWQLKSSQGDLAIVLDRDFPYSRPNVYWLDFDPAVVRPHVEDHGKLCLRSVVTPDRPVETVQSVAREAIELLEENEVGNLESDFQTDFLLYWNYRTSSRQIAGTLLGNLNSAGFGYSVSTNRGPCIFRTKDEAIMWLHHLSKAFPRKTPRVALIKLRSLPLPQQFPSSGAELRWLVENRSDDGCSVLLEHLSQIPKFALVVLVGEAGGVQHAVALRLSRPTNAKGEMVHWRAIARGHARGRVPLNVLCDSYKVQRLRSDKIDAAKSRLPYQEVTALASKRIAIVGCGALGSGVARLLAKAGIGNLVLVDVETLGWENIRRHELGASEIGAPKCEQIANSILRSLPDITSVTSHYLPVQELVRISPGILKNCDLIVSCTADWAADIALEDLQRDSPGGAPDILYAWMEAYGLAAHAVIIDPVGAPFRDGFNELGDFRLPVSVGSKSAPRECGADTTPFGAIELSQAQAMIAGLALDRIRGLVGSEVWRTWTTTEQAVLEAEAKWSDDWCEKKGRPSELGGAIQGRWSFNA